MSTLYNYIILSINFLLIGITSCALLCFVSIKQKRDDDDDNDDDDDDDDDIIT